MLSKKFSFAAISTVIFLSCVAANASAGQVLTCEKRNAPQRSILSVEAEDLKATATFNAIVKSGNNTATANPASSNALGVVEFDFDSNPKNILAGANAIGSNFIVGGTASVVVTDANGNSVASATANCKVR